MFPDNKYTRTYYKIIELAKTNVKVVGDEHQYHHIIPKALGGSDDKSNLALLTYKQHRVCHRLLIAMTEGQNKIKMSYAYSWFGKSAGKYKTGTDNNFGKPEFIALVKQRMLENNPMSTPEQKERMRLENPRNRAIVTPEGTFRSRAAALRHHKFKHWKVLYDLMKQYPQDYYWLHCSV